MAVLEGCAIVLYTRISITCAVKRCPLCDNLTAQVMDIEPRLNRKGQTEGITLSPGEAA